MSLSWDGMFVYAFPPFRFLLQMLLKIKQYITKEKKSIQKNLSNKKST
jgi:hypothetical protein